MIRDFPIDFPLSSVFLLFYSLTLQYLKIRNDHFIAKRGVNILGFVFLTDIHIPNLREKTNSVIKQMTKINILNPDFPYT